MPKVIDENKNIIIINNSRYTIFLFSYAVYHVHKKSIQPIPTGILSGLGEGLAKDDYADRDEWFKFEKKHDDTLVPETSTLSSSRDQCITQILQ